MAKAIAIWDGGIHDRRQRALREDGALFARYSVKSAYGWSWSSWSDTGERWGENRRANPDTSLSSGFCTLHLCRPNGACINDRAWFNAKGEIRARLP